MRRRQVGEVRRAEGQIVRQSERLPAVLGGVLGHQIGSGRGNTAATIIGAGAGVYAGNEVEKNKKTKTFWNVAVKMENGTTRNYTHDSTSRSSAKAIA